MASERSCSVAIVMAQCDHNMTGLENSESSSGLTLKR